MTLTRHTAAVLLFAAAPVSVVTCAPGAVEVDGLGHEERRQPPRRPSRRSSRISRRRRRRRETESASAGPPVADALGQIASAACAALEAALHLDPRDCPALTPSR